MLVVRFFNLALIAFFLSGCATYNAVTDQWRFGKTVKDMENMQEVADIVTGIVTGGPQ